MTPIGAAMNLAAEVYEPDDWFGVLGLGVITLPNLVLAVLGALLWRRQKSDTARVEQKVDTIKDNVQNGHQDPLRVDLDKKFDALDQKVDDKFSTVHEVLAYHGRDIRDIRADLHDLGRSLVDERDARIRLTDRVERIELRAS